ncbi:transposase [Homoserinimonas sp. OAct 916]|uniref:transposase n=1 Tax=Homoserinimonas sp. OAct 916 TaxID=2211450 RepID=UPI00210683DE|nr:transposase [Homoserinimonas sp. OAct 916]
MLTDAQPNLLAFACSRSAAGDRSRRTRWNEEFKRRTDVVGAFLNAAALLRLSGSVLIEQHDEWEAAKRRCFSEASMPELATMNNLADVIDEAVILSGTYCRVD